MGIFSDKLRCRKYFFTAKFAWIIAQYRKCLTIQKLIDWLKRNLAVYYGILGGRVAQDHAFMIKQVEFNAGVDDHEGFKHCFNGIGVNFTIDDKITLFNQVGSQRAVKFLACFA